MTCSRRPVADSTALICGAARNCGKAGAETFRTLRAAASGFREVRLVAVESDSADDTAERLEEAGAEVIRMGDLRRTEPLRTARLALCRNRLVEAVRASHGDVDYVILADLDGVNRTVTRSGLESAWNAADPWDAIFANQDGPYYDVWALRHPVWSPDDCWRAYRQLRPLFGDGPARRLVVTARQMRLSPAAGLIEVESAFGGLGLYRREAFLAGRYNGIDADGAETCEHVAFHRDLRAAGFRLFINAGLLNALQREHTAGSAGRLLRMLRARLGFLTKDAI